MSSAESTTPAPEAAETPVVKAKRKPSLVFIGIVIALGVAAYLAGPQLMATYLYYAEEAPKSKIVEQGKVLPGPHMPTAAGA